MIYNILNSSLSRMWPYIVIINLIILLIRVIYKIIKKEKIYFYKEVFLLLSITYFLLLYELLTRVDYNTLGGGVNIIPFAEISRYNVNSELFLLNVIGNIVLFIPFGFIISTYFKPKKVWYLILCVLFVSSGIELFQKQIGRSFDVDDIILNTIGCIIGYIIYKIYLKISNKISKNSTYNLLCLVFLVIIVLLYCFWGII